MSDRPQVTVVLEWENALLSSQSRSEEMLSRLAGQARALRCAVEVIVVCDAAGADAARLRWQLAQRLDPEGSPGLSWHLMSAPGAHYYELKNRGAAVAQGAVVVFLDSDVVPEAGWLAGIVAPFADPAVDVVAGHSYVDPRGLYGRAVALGWFFPLRSEGPPRQSAATHFWANNVAFRRELVLTHPFPGPEDGATRGACADLAQTLCRRGIPIRATTAAQVSHPPPNGPRHFAVRAVADGRDRVLRWRRAGKRRWALPFRSLEYYLRMALRAFVATVRHRRSVGLALLLVPAACVIQGTYYGLAFAGALATWAAPRPMSRGFRI